MSLLSPFRTLRRGEYSVIEEHPSPQPPHGPPISSQPDNESSPAPKSNHISFPQHYAQMAQDIRPSLPSDHPWLDPGDVTFISVLPIGAGGFANIYEATHSGRKVVLKSYRCYMSFDVAQVVARFRNEVQVWTLLHNRGADVVPLVGVYSTEAHPFGLVYEYMDGLDLKQHTRNEPDAGRLNLLTGILRGLNHMHDLGIVHGDLQTANILIDKDGIVRIAGLGNASILSRSTGLAMYGGAVSPNPIHLAHPTKANDMCAFGVIAWEILTGQPPFFGMTKIAGTFLMLKGGRPLRRSHNEISDRVWHIIERCWDNEPSKRMLVWEAANFLEAETRGTGGSLPSLAPNGRGWWVRGTDRKLTDHALT